MLGWKGKDISPEQDKSIEYYVLEKSDKRRSPKDGSSVKGNSNHIPYAFIEILKSILRNKNLSWNFLEVC